MTLDELDHKLPNGFHDSNILSIEIDYVAATAKVRLSLHVGWPDDPEPEREEYQPALLEITGLCFCSMDPPDPNYRFLPDGRGIYAGGDPAAANHLPSLPALRSKFPEGVWCYRFFIHDWNAFIHIAGRDAEVIWIGPKPKHAE